MKRFLLFLFAGLPLAAQPQILAGPVHNPHDLSHSMARVAMVVNVNSRRVVEFGTTSTPAPTWRRRYPEYSSQFDKHEWFIDGLNGGTQYYWRMCVSQDTHTSGITVQVNPANTVTKTAHGFIDGELIMLSANSSASTPAATGTLYNLNNNGPYYVLNATANTFQITLANDGTADSITGSLSGYIRAGKATCSDVQTFTTPADPAIHPAPPLDVTVTSPDASPTITGTTYAADANCQVSGVDFQTFLNTTIAGLTGSTNVAITFPDGADCRQAYIFPSRAHTGWVVLKPASAAAHPPERVRTTPAFVTQKPKFTHNAAPVMYRAGTTSVNITACPGVGHIHMSNSSNQFLIDAPGISNLWNCISSTGATVAKTITAISAGTLATTQFTVPAHGWSANVGYLALFSGTGIAQLDAVAFPLLVVDADTLKIHTNATNAAAACSDGTCGTITLRTNKVPIANSFGPIGDRPAEPCTNGTLWSVMETELNNVDVCRDQAWVRMRYAANGPGAANVPAIAVEGSKYRFENLEIRYERWPEEVATLYGDWGTGDQKQGRIGTLINTDDPVSDVVFDRCDIHSYDYPTRSHGPINLGGQRISIINSRMHGFFSWLKFPHPGLLEVNGVQLMRVKDVVFRNNFINASGITIYVHPNPGAGTEYTQIHTPQKNILIQRNLFQKLARNRTGSTENYSANANRAYSNRHHFEFKSGEQTKIDGNVFDYNWSYTAQGAPILQTPTGGNVGSWISSPISNITAGVITYTTTAFLDLLIPPVGLPVMVAVYNTDNSALHGIYTVTNTNAVANTITVTGMPAGSATSGTVTVMFSTSGVLDVMISNNTISRAPVGTYSNAYNTAQQGFLVRKSRRVVWHNNWFNDLNRRGCKYPSGLGVCDISTGPPFGYHGATGPEANGGDGYVLLEIGHGEDFQWTNNTATDVDGHGQSMVDFSQSQYQNGEGFTFRNNLFMLAAGTTGTVSGIGMDSPIGPSGSDGLSGTFPDRLGSSKKGWTARNNVLPHSVINPSTYTGIATLTNRSAVNFGVTPRLRWDSPHVSGGAFPADDLRDAGVDVRQLKIAQGQVDNVRLRSTSVTPLSAASTAAIVSYIAPDTEACELRVSTTAWGLGTPVADGGGARSRNTTIALSAGTTDNVALLCATQSFVCPELGGTCTLVPHQ